MPIPSAVGVFTLAELFFSNYRFLVAFLAAATLRLARSFLSRWCLRRVIFLVRKIFMKCLKRREGVSDLMRQTAGERGDGLQLLRLRHLPAEEFVLFGDLQRRAFEETLIDKFLDPVAQGDEDQGNDQRRQN